jgi:hypothetical protein
VQWLFQRRTVPGKEIGIGQLYPLIERTMSRPAVMSSAAIDN